MQLFADKRSIYTENASLGYENVAFCDRFLLNKSGRKDRFDCNSLRNFLVSKLHILASAKLCYILGLQISLEFYQRKRARWPFPAECIPWEVWTIKLDIITLNNEHGKDVMII